MNTTKIKRTTKHVSSLTLMISCFFMMYKLPALILHMNGFMDGSSVWAAGVLAIISFSNIISD